MPVGINPPGGNSPVASAKPGGRLGVKRLLYALVRGPDLLRQILELCKVFAAVAHLLLPQFGVDGKKLIQIGVVTFETIKIQLFLFRQNTYWRLHALSAPFLNI